MMTTIKAKQPVKLRHKLKHSISLHDDLVLASKLRRLFQLQTSSFIDAASAWLPDMEEIADLKD
ncbi:MAG: hypothetical protein ACOXZM_06785 [Eubacteriales bacterium]